MTESIETHIAVNPEIRRAPQKGFLRWLAASVFMGAVLLGTARRAGAATITVTVNLDGLAPGPVGSLRNALSSAVSGDTIDFNVGLNGQTIVLTNGVLPVANAVTITGLGAANLAISGNNLYRVFNVTANNVTISGLTLTKGNAPGAGSNGGAIIQNNGSNGTLILDAVTVSGSTAYGKGGGIYLYKGTLTLRNGTVISGNTASTGRGGGIFNKYGTLTVSNSTITGNTSGRGGGGISLYNGSVLALQNSTVSYNNAKSGGGVYCSSATATIDNSVLTKNNAINGGGAIYSTFSTLKIQNNSKLTFNTASKGGGALYSSGTVTIDNSTVSNNTAVKNGGGIINNSGNITIQNGSVVSNNTAGNTYAGGGIRNTGTLKIDKSTISSNSARNGAGVYNYNGTLTVQNSSVISGNTATNKGGGVYSKGTLTVKYSTLSGNAAYNGAGVYVVLGTNNNLIANSTLSGNAASGNGGGVFSIAGIKIANSTLSGNTAANDGGGIYNLSNYLNVQSSTVANNTATALSGGGIYNLGLATATLSSSIVSGNTAPTNSDLNGTFNAYYSLVYHPGNATLNGKYNILGQDPKLLPLASNNGPTQTHAITAASPAHDAGLDPAGVAFDQRGKGFSRASGNGPDIGAFEVQDPATGLIVTNLNNGGTGSLRHAVNAANRIPGPDTVQFQAGLTGSIVLTSGQININDSITIPGPVNGTGAPVLSVDGNNASLIFYVHGAAKNVTLSGLTLTHGKGYRGGALYARLYSGNSLSISNAVISGNNATLGGGIFLYGSRSSSVTLSNDYILNNVAVNDGGGLCSGFKYGSKFYSGPRLTIQNATIISGNTSTNGEGGGISLTKSNATIQNSTINGNNQAVVGGGIAVRYYAQLTLNQSTISSNSTLAGPGGGIFLYNHAQLTLNQSTVSNNTSYGGGGGIYSDKNGTMTLTGATLSGNSTTDGGGAIGLGNSSVATIDTSTLSGDSASAGNGGGIEIGNNSRLTLKNSAISGEGAQVSGGAINFAGPTASLSILNSSLSANKAVTGNGGGINVATINNRPYIQNSTLYGNSSAGYGGGINLGAQTYARIQNSTISKNTAAKGGGGVYSSATYNPASSPKIQSTIISGNKTTGGSGPDLSGAFLADHSLLYHPTGATLVGPFNITGVNPNLGTLQNNNSKGPTLTQALPSGSPAIDAGTNAANVGTDQRGPGFPRFEGAAVDIGAFELQVAPKTFIVTNLNDSGPNSLRAAITQSNAYGGPNTIQFQAGLSGTILLTSGSIPVTNSVTIPGPGPATLAVDGNNASQIFAISGPTATDVTVSGLTLTHGNTIKSGGAIGNDARRAFKTNLTINNAIITGNTSTLLGGGIYNYGALTLQNSTVSNNSSAREGGGLDSLGTANVQNSVVTGNNSSDGGGGIFSGGSLSLQNSTVSSNVGGYNGGGLYARARYATDTISIQNSTLSSNVCLGVSLYNRGLYSGKGGGVFVRNLYSSITSLTIQNSVVTNNTANNGGGGLYLYGNNGPITVQSSVISNNTASSKGGGVCLNNPGQGSLVDSSTLAGNISFSNGGGLYQSSSKSGYRVTLSNSTLSGNSAKGNGGGVDTRGSLTLVNSTLSGNAASSYGGGIYGNKYTIIQNSTIFNNQASKSGGGISQSGTPTLQSTLVAGNRAATNPDLNGTFNAEYCLIQTPGTATINATTPGTNILNIAPVLGPLAKNNAPQQLDGALTSQVDGAPLTNALLLGSPGIDAGSNPANLAFDERGTGFPRVVGVKPDIGAIESQLPIANAGGPYTINEGSGLTLDGSKSVDTEGNPLTYSWDINGDGVFGDATGVQPVLTATQLAALGIGTGPGTFNVTVQVSDGVHNVKSASVLLTVLNVAPTVAITGAPASSQAFTAITLNSTVTDPGTADTFTYAWSVTNNGAVFATATTPGITFTPNVGGTFVVSLTVTDKAGATGSDSKTITVTPVNMTVAINGAPATVAPGVLVSVTSSVTDSNAAAAAAGFTYAWSVTKNGNAFAAASTQNFSFTPDAPGTYVISLTATDINGVSGTASSTVNVPTAGTPLVVTSSPTASPDVAGVGQIVAFLVVATTTPGATLTYTWDFGDGSTGSGPNPTHAYSAAGQYTATVTITDSNGNTVTGTVGVQVNASIVGSGPDSDGDGFSDSFEIAVGSDPLNANSTPFGTLPVRSSIPLPDIKLSIHLNFAKPGKDSIKMSGSLVFKENVSVADQRIIVGIGDVIKIFTVSPNGSLAHHGSDVFTSGGKGSVLKVRSKGLGLRTVQFAMTLSNGNFAATLAKLGLTNANLSKVPVNIPLVVLVENTAYVKSQAQHYTAHQGKTGATSK